MGRVERQFEHELLSSKLSSVLGGGRRPKVEVPGVHLNVIHVQGDLFEPCVASIDVDRDSHMARGFVSVVVVIRDLSDEEEHAAGAGRRIGLGLGLE